MGAKNVTRPFVPALPIMLSQDEYLEIQSYAPGTFRIHIRGKLYFVVIFLLFWLTTTTLVPAKVCDPAARP
jgi:hypothetical protein